jgi:RNA polymerase sigma factor (TIGR02999 family)
MGDPTQIREALEQAVPNTPENLLPLVYNELRRLAARKLANERPGQTLEATALVHEAWLKLIHEEGRSYSDPTHFYCAAATAMRRILIDHARRRNTPKHGGDLCRTTLGDVAPAELMPTDDLIALDEALSQLAEEDPDAVRLVELRFFTGLRHQEAARLMGITRRQADGLWAYARAWLYEAVQTNLGAMQAPKSP